MSIEKFDELSALKTSEKNPSPVQKIREKLHKVIKTVGLATMVGGAAVSSDSVEAKAQSANNHPVIITHDPKDKRIKNYQDSLSLYRLGLREKALAQKAARLLSQEIPDTQYDKNVIFSDDGTEKRIVVKAKENTKAFTQHGEEVVIYDNFCDRKSFLSELITENKAIKLSISELQSLFQNTPYARA